MKKMLIMLPVVTLLISGCQLGSNSSNSNPANTNTSVSQTNANLNTQVNNPNATDATNTSIAQKFTDSADFDSSYLISGLTLDEASQRAIQGFQLSKQVLPDGSTQIKLKAIEAGYQDKLYTLKPDQKLYFIDRTLGDDRGTENNTGDDYGVIVDNQGYIVSSEQ